MSQEIVFRVNGKKWEATVSDREWKRSLVGDDHMVVEHSSTSYVIGMDRTGTLFAYPITEDVAVAS